MSDGFSNVTVDEPADDFAVLDPKWRPYQEAVLPVFEWHGRERRFEHVGTAFAVAPDGLFATARHVVADFVDDHQEETFDGSTGLFLVYETDDAVTMARHTPVEQHVFGGLVPIIAVSGTATTDAALLRAAPLARAGRPVRFPVLTLNIRPPIEGSAVTAIGYARRFTRIVGDAPQANEGASRRDLDYRRYLAAGPGIVDEVYLDNANRYKEPGLLTDARTDGGMSGGPVVDRAGDVVGIVSIGMDTAADVRSTTFASLTGELFNLAIPFSDESADPIVALTGLEGVRVKGLPRN